MAFGSLIGDIKNVIDGNLPFGIGGAKSKKYPTFGTGSEVAPEDVSNYITTYGTEWRESRGYAFQVYRADDGALTEIADWKEFRLQINPQELTQDEIFAIEVTPTLRGVLVEHHGTILKDISISGTTGISPNRREAGTNRNGSPIFAVGHSGYEEFHELRTYFRMYVELKRKDAEGTLRMVFKNFKDNEFLFVEPTKFSMKRSAKKPMMYDYAIQLKGLGVAHVSTADQDWSTLFKIADNLDAAFEYMDQGVRAINGAFAIINRFQRDLNSILIAPVQAVQGAIQAVRGGIAQTLTQMNITRKAIDDLLNICSNIELNFNDAIGRSTSSYNAASGRTPTIIGNPNRVTTYDELKICNALNDIKKGLLLVAGLNDQVFEQNVFQLNSGVINTYAGNIDLRTPSSVEPVEIQGGDNIQTIASREFGNPDKYRDIIILNNLKAPYISDTPGPGVLSPGMKILIPRYSGNTSSGTVKNKQYNITSELTESEKSLGVDIRVTDDGDLAISNTNDLDLIAGMQNMGQAAGLKLSYERGSLKRHVNIGTDLQLGRKGVTALQTVREQILSSYSSDNRVESIPFLELRQEGGTVSLTMLLKLRNVDQPIPIPLKINV